MRTTDPDMVDRVLDYLEQEVGALARRQREKIGRAIRAEFAGERVYVPKRGATDRAQMVSDVLALFNGRNAAEVARRVGVSRQTVYRVLKQAGVHSRPRSVSVLLGLRQAPE